jgi:hypothetical protein
VRGVPGNRHSYREKGLRISQIHDWPIYRKSGQIYDNAIVSLLLPVLKT